MLRKSLRSYYRIIPHIDRDIEELADVQQYSRWKIGSTTSYAEPERRAEQMVRKLNAREVRRRGIFPERSIARRISNTYAVDGKVCEPYYKVKMITFTVVSFDGHPFVFRMWPIPNRTINNLIDGCGMCYGYPQLWSRCLNQDCSDYNHGEGCLVNLDVDTLNKLPAPNRREYMHMTFLRRMNRGDITFNTRFSCQLRITEQMDGAVIALKQYHSRHLRAMATDWEDIDNSSLFALARQARIEPWAPPVEKPMERDFPVSLDLLWAEDYEEILQQKYPWYQRKDGFSTRPELWASYV
eukprot:PhF_6_TR24016/c0_g1_i1/m.33624